MIPSDIDAGYENGDPLAESVSSYDEYPDDYDEVDEFRYADVIGEVMTAVGHYEQWACDELGVSSIRPWDPDLADNYVEDTTGDLHINLERQDEPRNMMKASRQQWHKGEFGRTSPFDANHFAKSTWGYGYDPEDVAEWFADMTAEDVLAAWGEADLIKEFKIEIEGGETLRRSNYGDPAWQDPRVLEAFDEADYTIAEVADYFNVSQNRIRRECIRWKMTEAQQNGGGAGSQVDGYAGSSDKPRKTSANTV